MEWTDIAVEFGDHLKRCRLATKLSERDFAKKARLTARTIDRVEKAETCPKMDTLLLYANACEMSIKELFEPWISKVPETEDDHLIVLARRTFKNPQQGPTLRNVIRSFGPSSPHTNRK